MKRAKMAAASGFTEGTRLGKYEILRPLARGGMAELYLARPQSLPGFEKLLAIKRVLPELARRKDVLQMFLDEARLASTLEHPNVIQTYDVGVVDGNYFLAMEFLHGQSLFAILNALEKRYQRLSLDISLEIAVRVCAGLHYAHERRSIDGGSLGIVHRDVSPQNVFVTYSGGVKLIDFGVAKAANQVNETRHGTIKGKLRYLSPEQVRCEPVDRRSDVFSLGILLYEMTLGHRPFPGGSDFEMINQITDHAIVRPTTLDPAYPPVLEQIVMRALERPRERRQQTAFDLGNELEGAARELGLYLSSSVLVKFMEDVFPSQATALREARRPEATQFEQIESLSSLQMVEMPRENWVRRPEGTQAVGDSMVELEAHLPDRDRERNRSLSNDDPPSTWSVALGALVAAVIIVVVTWFAGSR